jgi:hypothetical protein
MAEQVGVAGAALDVDPAVKLENLIIVLKDKILHPDKYLPVSNVFTRPSDDGKGTYREMSLGPNRIIENIYWDQEELEVQFKVRLHCSTNV